MVVFEAEGGMRDAQVAGVQTCALPIFAAELIDSEGNPIEGFTRADYQVWHGESKAQTLHWLGGDVCPTDYAAVRFYIKRARLYGFGWT